ncbi:hypothetical protein QBC40DRAFT_283330 [Triangularia verruculosa]|uniref:Transmembrane protein n=1 Tax=Triangularia verruculosa TaxID=2587418 RepID=A0AAN6XDR0_9PEZI|nr:hypothetical protein QBC40DRAFT_283330 [Triangularia verruculosa]
MTAFRPTPRLSTATFPNPSSLPRARPKGVAANVVIPGIVVAASVYVVISYIKSQLSHESSTIDKMFAQKNTPAVEESRRRSLLIETEGDPRRTPYNILNWK